MAEWYEEGGALNIKSGAELERFDLGTVKLNGTTYTVLTGYEPTGRCFWCGGELKGKLQRYCYGHMKEYYRHFEWASASRWALNRAGHRCENCGTIEINIAKSWYAAPYRSNLEVHHIIPLKGERRYFSVFNLPWNLTVLCHDCHMELHAVMSPPKTPWAKSYDNWALAQSQGQAVMDLNGIVRG